VVIVASVAEIVLLGAMGASVGLAVAAATAVRVPVVSEALGPGVIVDLARVGIADPGRRAAPVEGLLASHGTPKAVPAATVPAVGPVGPTSVPSR